MSAPVLFFWLLVGHALADYPLQGEFLSQAKNYRAPVVANGQAFPWPLALGMHALIHGGAVALVTRSVALGIAEAGAHAAIDYATCAGRTGGYWGDQALHVVCKALWVALALGAAA